MTGLFDRFAGRIAAARAGLALAPGLRTLLLWACLLLLTLLRFLVSSDLALQIAFYPHDDSLYVERAWHLLNGEAFGPYNSRILDKYPGITLWLAGARVLGIPFLLSVNVLYVVAGAYLLIGLQRAGVGRLSLLAAGALYLFNPMTFGEYWIRALREPLATGLLALLIACIVHIYVRVDERRRPWGHVAFFTVTFAFALFLREEDRLLWLFLALFVSALVWQLVRAGLARERGWQAFALACLVAPAFAATAYGHLLRSFVERNYGAPIIHETGEGEFPRMMAAIRSVKSAKDNRLVMASQETLAQLRVQVPELAPVIERLPPPGPGTYSCLLQGVCSEWSNGWMPYWIKDTAYQVGATPTLPAAQAYFRRVREGIEKACAEGRLRCEPKGVGLVPPFELRWMRALVHEGLRLVLMLLKPEPRVVDDVPEVYDVPVELGRAFQMVTMTDRFDSLRQTSAVAKESGAARYTNPFRPLRLDVVAPYQALAIVLLVIAAVMLVRRTWMLDVVPLEAVSAGVIVFAVYSLARLLALAYIAVFFGPFESRIVLMTYALAVPLAAVAIGHFRGPAASRTE